MEEKLLRLHLMFIFVIVVGNVVTSVADGSQAPNNATQTTPTSHVPSLEGQESFGANNSTQKSGDTGLLERSLYAAVGLSAVVVIYFVIRTIRTKRRKSKTKKYGVIHGTGDLEMQPLEREDDDEEDVTVFDMNDRRNNK